MSKVALILGGTGTVGGGIALSFLSKGFKVIVTSRSQASLYSFKECVDKKGLGNHLILLKGDVGDENDALRLKQEIEQSYGMIDL